MTDTGLQDELTARYMARTEVLADAAGAAMAAAWDDLGGYDEPDITRLAATARPVALEYAAAAAAISSAYLSLLLDVPPPGVTRPVEPDWRGPFTHHWGALANGETWDAALEAGRSRADAAGRQSVISTGRRVGDQLSTDRVAGWRRVLSADPCPWCISVAGQDYATAASADFGHDRCHCGVTPILR